MATSGAFNGTDVFIRVNDGADWLSLGGQLYHTETLTNALIDITNKIGAPKFRELLPDEGIQQVDYTVELVFVSQAGYDFVRALAGNKGQALFQVIRGDVATGTVPIEVTLQVQSFVDTSVDGEALKGTVNLLSSDLFDFDANFTYARFLTSALEPFKVLGGDQLYVRIP
ncbi:hypothetical protein KAR91_15365 [Candidatus Pacearchaeota archaeon]|nr:hypothetical protein [Candidatus Pacearchaeota archaeon]